MSRERREEKHMLYVGHLSSRINRQELQDEFERFGTIKDIDLRRTHAFIELSTSDEAKAAVDAMDGHKFHGEKIVCQQKGE